MRYNDRRFSIEGGAGLMGKYQLKSRKEGSVITLLEVDTECRAWYVKADDKDAAVKTLISMGESIRCLESIYVNGDDMTEDILSAFSAARKMCRLRMNTDMRKRARLLFRLSLRQRK